MPNPADESFEQQLRSACQSVARRVAGGDRDVVDDILRSHPELAEDEEASVELLYTEFVERERLGQRPDVESWRAKYPKLSHRLAVLAQLHDAMGNSPLTAGDRNVDEEDRPTTTRRERIGKFEIVGRVAEGAMGTVYRAHDVELGRQVALKIVSIGGGNHSGNIARFRTEAETIASLSHPGIVPIFDVGQSDDRLYLALQYVSGGTLTQRIGDKPMHPRDAAQMALLIAEAVGYAHCQNVVHRDLKPDNVLIDEDGKPKLIDFGLAKILDDDQFKTRSGAVIGTPCYMSPEQAAGRPADKSSDVYAIGVILFEMLTGRVPFTGATTWETLEQIETLEPVPPRTLVPKVPQDLETICLKCLDKTPNHRYLSADDLADDLRRYMADETIAAKPVSFLGHLVRSIRRTRHPVPSYRMWSRVCFVAAPIPSLILLLVTLSYRDHPAFASIAILATLVIVTLMQSVLSKVTRHGLQYLPIRMRRHASNVFFANLLGQGLVIFILWWHQDVIAADNSLLLIFPISCVMLAIVFWSFASEMGMFHLVALASLVFAFVGALNLHWSPVITSLIFLVNFGSQGFLYRTLAEQIAPGDQVPS